MKIHPIIRHIFTGEKLENKLAINKEKCDFQWRLKNKQYEADLKFEIEYFTHGFLN